MVLLELSDRLEEVVESFGDLFLDLVTGNRVGASPFAMGHEDGRGEDCDGLEGEDATVSFASDVLCIGQPGC